MTAERKRKLWNGSLIASNLAVIATLVGVGVRYGATMERLDAFVSNAVSIDDFTDWAHATSTANSNGWKFADMKAIHRDNIRDALQSMMGARKQ